MKKRIVTEIDSNELDELVKKHLGYSEYEFVPVEECGNDSSHEFTVDGKIDAYEEKDLAKWKAGQFVHYSNGLVLNELARQGYIEKGEYLVTVCW